MGTLSDALVQDLSKIPGTSAVGHTRYSTAGLVDDRQRPAGRRALQGRLHHARPQRQPDQRGRGAARARGQGFDLRLDERLGGHRPRARAVHLADARAAARRRVEARGWRLQPDRRDGRHDARCARPARLASTRHGPPRRRGGVRVGDVRARHRRRDVRARRRAGRDRVGERQRRAVVASAAETGIAPLRVRVRVLRAAGQPRVRRLGRSRASRARQAARARTSGADGRTRVQRARLVELRRAGIRRGEWAALRARAHPQSLRGSHVHPADAGRPRRESEGEVQSGPRDPRRQERRDRRRLDRARHDDARPRRARARRRCARGAHARELPAGYRSVLLRHRHARRAKS